VSSDIPPRVPPRSHEFRLKGSMLVKIGVLSSTGRRQSGPLMKIWIMVTSPFQPRFNDPAYSSHSSLFIIIVTDGIIHSRGVDP